MTAVPGERQLKDGQDSLDVKFESAEVGGVKLVKTYTLKRGAYDIAVRHDVVNNGAQRRVAAAVPAAGARRQQAARRVVVLFHLHRPGASTPRPRNTRRSSSSDIENNKVDVEKQASNGYVAMVQHYFASAWILPDGLQRDIFLRKVDTNLYAVGMITPLQAIAPGATQSTDGDAVCRPAGRKAARSHCARPGAGQGLRLADHPGQAAVLAARQAVQLHAQLGLVDRGAGGAAENRVLLAQCQGLCQHGQDEGGQSQDHGNARAPEGQAAGNAGGHDEDLQGRKGQPHGWLLPHHDPDPGVHRPVLGAAELGGNAQCALDPVDQGSVLAGSLLHPAAA